MSTPTTLLVVVCLFGDTANTYRDRQTQRNIDTSFVSRSVSDLHDPTHKQVLTGLLLYVMSPAQAKGVLYVSCTHFASDQLVD